MEVQYINPFISAMNKTLETMLGIVPKRGQPYLKNNKITEGDISGLIGFAEKNIIGSVAISFPQETALFVYEKMTSDKITSLNREVQDSIGELANIVAGNAKTILSDKGLSFHISIPTVIVGKNHHISHKAETPIVVIPFHLQEFTFIMEVTMKISKPHVE